MDEQNYKAEVTKDITLLAQMCTIIPIQIKESMIRDSSIFLFTPHDQNKFIMDHSITSLVHNSIIYLPCFNDTPSTIKLKAGYSPGTFSSHSKVY